MRKAYVFISSSADARLERQRVSRLIERLNVDFGDVVTFEAVRWEDRIYSAHTGFQQQIRKSTSCDVVIAILRGRIGLPLSREFIDQLPDEERVFDDLPTPTGTVYELLTAIAARRRGEKLPDIYAFRYAYAPTLSLDAHDRADVEFQWRQLQYFIERVFMTPEGSFRGALEPFTSVDDFESKAERALRLWIGDNIPAAKGASWPITLKGSPFRGLEPFGPRHAEVFFGRRADLRRALSRLRRLAERGSPFLAIVGPSGSGKSSFARAGLIPALVKPGAVERVAVWRVAVMRPGGGRAIANLARCLYDGPEDLPKDERGRPCALPELKEGDSPRHEDLLDLFRVAAGGGRPEERGREAARRAATAPISRALARIAEAEKRRIGSEADGRARLLLLVDQFDELFAAETSEDVRIAFAVLLKALLATGDVWVVATLRADTLDPFLKSAVPGLWGGSSDEAAFPTGEEPDHLLSLAPPAMADVGDIVRGPAAAAGLAWERHPTSGQPLDERVLADVDRPDLMPLLQFVLQNLFEQRVEVDGTPTLTWAAYDRLGSLDGAIETSAERALGSLDAAATAALPRLLRALVTYGRSGSSGRGPMLLRAPRALVDADAHVKALADALIDARLLISTQAEGGQPAVSLAHQRVLDAWAEARAIVDGNESLLRSREAIAAAYEAWKETGRADRLIPPGSLLWDAERAARTLADEIPSEQRRFVSASSNAARRRQRMIAAAAIVFAAVSIAAVISAGFFLDARNRAERNLAAAKHAIAGLDDFIWRANQGAEDQAGFTMDRVGASLAEVQRTLDELAAGAPDDLDLLSVRAGNAANLVDAFRALHVPSQAEAAAESGVTTAARMAALSPSDPRTLKAEAVAAYKMADVRTDAVDRAGAIAEARRAERLAANLAVRPEADAAARRLLWVATEKLGEALLATKDPDAIPTLARATTLARASLAEADADASRKRDLALSLAGEGRAALLFGNVPAALAYASAFLTTARQLVAAEPANGLFARDEALAELAEGSAKFAGGDLGGAIADLDAAVTIARQLGDRDPLDAAARHDLLTILTTRAQFMLDRDRAAARADLDEALRLARSFAALDGNGARSQFDLASVLMHIALDVGDDAGEAEEARSLVASLGARGLMTDRDRAAVAQFEALMR